ncbi:hypothetical protein SUNI508_00041 [Seiridium unicorne]|uniref:Uncharacterized protein n=1 Tax=Seiridium unicorne TaxID=138068 RepID=A0ABR2VHY0_9PEZI
MATPKSGQTNFRTYEAQARLLAAVIATAKPKLDYKAIARHIGSDATPAAVDHRLRPLKQLAKLQAKCLDEGKDPMNLPIEKADTTCADDSYITDVLTSYAEIQKLFGESTAGGLEFHFREVKATGKAQQDAVRNNKDPTEVPVGPQTRQIPKGAKAKVQKSAPTTPATVRKRAAPTSGLATTGGRARKQPRHNADAVDSDQNSPDEDYDVLDQDTPSKPKPRAARNPSYTVNNSTTNSEEDSPLAAPQSYARTQAENQARARAEMQAEAFQGRPYGAHIDFAADAAPARGSYRTNSTAQHQSIFGGPNATWPNNTAGPPNPTLAAAPAHDDDELMEINQVQFSAGDVSDNGNDNHNRPGDLSAIKSDPFETDNSDFIDMTLSNQDDQLWGNHPSSVTSSLQRNQGWGNFHTDSYGDGEI